MAPVPVSSVRPAGQLPLVLRMALAPVAGAPLTLSLVRTLAIAVVAVPAGTLALSGLSTMSLTQVLALAWHGALAQAAPAAGVAVAVLLTRPPPLAGRLTPTV